MPSNRRSRTGPPGRASTPTSATSWTRSGPLANAMRYGDVRGTDVESLRVLFDEFVERILAGVVDVRHVARRRRRGARPSSGCRACRRRSASSTTRRGYERFPDVLATLASGRATASSRGRSTRLLHDSGVWSADDVERRLSLARSARARPPPTGAAFVEGFLAGSGTVLVHDAELLGVARHVAGVADRRGVRRRGRAAAADVRCVRARRATPDHDAARDRPTGPHR